MTWTFLAQASAAEGLLQRLLTDYPAEGKWWGAILAMLVAVLAVFGFLNLFALFAVWLERKVSAHMQCRLGPMEVGPHGVLQTIADGIKLTVKEDIIPRVADKVLFILAPVIVFTGTFIRFAPLPFGDYLVATDLDLGLFYIAAVGSVEVLGVIMAGWSSNNKWALFGTIRTATQMVSYEIPIGIAFVTVAVSAGTLSTMQIVEQQSGWFWHWFVFRNPFLMVLTIIYIIASLAECKRAPFDLPEAESELVSGFHTEYTGIRFALFFLAEYAAMYLVSAVAVVAFYGGWYTGIPLIDQIGAAPDSSTLAFIIGLLIKAHVLIGKAVGIVFVQMWVRWTLPRVRLDQMMSLCLKVLLPISLACLVGSAFWKLVFGVRYFGFLPPEWFT
jgi:NADH-quinone oxidoreductase subunit H